MIISADVLHGLNLSLNGTTSSDPTSRAKRRLGAKYKQGILDTQRHVGALIQAFDTGPNWYFILKIKPLHNCACEDNTTAVLSAMNSKYVLN